MLYEVITGYLLFNDIDAARRIRYTPGEGVSIAMERNNQANGLTRDLQGRIVSAEHLTRRVTRYEPDRITSYNVCYTKLLRAICSSCACCR